MQTVQLDTKKLTRQIATIDDCLQWGMKLFEETDIYCGQGFDNPWDEALSIVYSVMHLPWSSDESVLPLKPDPEQKQEIIVRFKKRALDKVPVAYVNREAWFVGLPFYVDERVLIPRSPIGELIEDRFSLWFDEAPQTVLDLCSGSGCLAIACAMAFEEAQVDASDIADAALAVATMNRNRYQLDNRVHLVKSDMFKGLAGRRYDLIVSNPPYVDARDMRELPPEFRHEPRMALAAGEDGLHFVDTILNEAGKHLTENGILIVEVGNSEQALAEKYPQVPFMWLEFARGGQGVFMLDKHALDKFFAALAE